MTAKFRPTAKRKREVSIAAGAGTPHEEIALGLGISQPTLRKYFAYELTTGAYKRRQEVLNAMFEAAKNGNVAAQKAYISLSTHISAPSLPPEHSAKSEGKKAQRQADAVTAQKGTEWADLLQTPAQ